MSDTGRMHFTSRGNRLAPAGLSVGVSVDPEAGTVTLLAPLYRRSLLLPDIASVCNSRGRRSQSRLCELGCDRSSKVPPWRPTQHGWEGPSRHRNPCGKSIRGCCGLGRASPAGRPRYRVCAGIPPRVTAFPVPRLCPYSSATALPVAVSAPKVFE